MNGADGNIVDSQGKTLAKVEKRYCNGNLLMRVRNLDKNGDWTFGQSDSNYAKKTYAVVLDLKMRLKRMVSGLLFALNKGIPWNIRLGSHNQKSFLIEISKNTALGTNGVLNIF